MPDARNGRTILLAEDDIEVRGYLETALNCQGYTVEVARDGEELLSCLNGRQTPVSAVLLDIIMPRRDGFEALKEIRRFNTDLPVIMISGAASALNVVEAMKNGATDFISKPINPEDLRKALKSALHPPILPPVNGDEAAAPPNKQIFFGNSPAIRELRDLIGQIARSEVPVLIQGETGSGKEMVARELHTRSPRARKPMLKLNCAALPSELVESELFGYERGAFTGAVQKKPGIFDLADGGTILLDEIGDMDFKLQAKLLQVLQDQEFQRLGGKEPIRVDVRVIAATHRDLEKAIDENTFREDLYHRLNVINIRVPPLRERREDIIAIAEFLVRKHSTPSTPLLTIPPPLRDVLLEYQWPGNIRELENVIRKYLVLRAANIVEQDVRARMVRRNGTADKPAAARMVMPARMEIETPTSVEIGNCAEEAEKANTPPLEQLKQNKEDAERNALRTALKTTNWNRRQAAVLLRVDYKALLYKMKRLGIEKEKSPAGAA